MSKYVKKDVTENGKRTFPVEERWNHTELKPIAESVKIRRNSLGFKKDYLQAYIIKTMFILSLDSHHILCNPYGCTTQGRIEHDI